MMTFIHYRAVDKPQDNDALQDQSKYSSLTSACRSLAVSEALGLILSTERSYLRD